MHRQSRETATDSVLSVRDLESAAKQRLDPAVYDFIAGGAEDEITLRANEGAFARIGLVPRVLRGRGTPELGATLLGYRTAMPVLVGPTAFHRLVNEQGERAKWRRAARRTFGSSSTSSRTSASPKRSSGAPRKPGARPSL
jgi:4-hydroxymandelate oxidase